MGQITEFPFSKKIIPLAQLNENNKNCFSILLGKNGVGKSRLLSELVNNFSKPLFDKTSKYYTGIGNFIPSKIIAVSTSPFDKFPAPKKDLFSSSVYSYVGMRTTGLQASNQMALIVSAAKGLMVKYLESAQHENLAEIFGLLKLKPSLNFVFKLDIKPKLAVTLSNGAEVKFYARGIMPDFHDESSDFMSSFLDDLAYAKFKGESSQVQQSIKDSLAIIWDQVEHQRGFFFKLDFDYSSKYRTGFISREVVSAVLTLLSTNILKLYDLKITKLDSPNLFDMSLRRASSGEQCLLVIMLGIAGHIRDNSLVLIDEPEISLHPSWQTRFMDLLINIFKNYEDCHFIIATHSPQIVARLSQDNCFITTMDDNKLHSAMDFHNKSADFQLTELFESPGIMNEYVSRISFTLLSKVKSQKELKVEDISSLSHLSSIKNLLEAGDPNIELISSVTEVCEFYASNN